MGTDVMNFRMLMPEIRVEVIQREQLPEIKKLINDFPHYFPSLKTGERVKQQGDKLLVYTYGETPARVFTEVGDFYLTSDNGQRCFTSDPKIKHGIFIGIPHSLLVPTYGEKLN